ncbi:hypothetical protein DAPPUDRAFT_241138 [Daphnia pulex]|uniref:C1q domain-containing protein n=1 Tax=Daphnia pulex TaxID=6669 RepID=E9GDI0_DAPPU|nr:hypothetical protein DAPPUDRAFT_241138 [Daphnia pulex]|eukprot:EFX82472.1 hypothetical protein DAPPUDRAFT_241138 [Daphnia pulex]
MELKNNLESKVVQLEAKVVKLEEKVQHQESLLIALQSQQPINSKSVSAISQPSGKIYLLRTCRETRAADPSLGSGMYWIDPDGQGVGDDPIYVYCNMATGSTEILHDTESKTDVGNCADPGCYTKAIKYNATMRQIMALAELSNECHQSIRYDCTSAPLEINGITYSWWDDRNGNPQYFWSGSNSSVHVCQCGLDGNCVESPSVMCNCDSSLPTLLSDNGVIRDKNLLPITRLNFGRTILAGSSGNYTLGRLECSGQMAVTGMPKSCEDLWWIGHTLTGLYSVMGTAMVENVYCDFTKLPSEAGFEKKMGFVDVQSVPTYFLVTKNETFNSLNMSISYTTEKLNIGGAMDLSSGKFTAPRTGTYFFSFTGMIGFPTSSSSVPYLILGFYLNGVEIGSGWNDEANTVVTQEVTVVLQSTVNLQAGDQVEEKVPQKHFRF